MRLHVEQFFEVTEKKSPTRAYSKQAARAVPFALTGVARKRSSMQRRRSSFPEEPSSVSALENSLTPVGLAQEDLPRRRLAAHR